MKITKNTKINHIMVSFTDHYNAISIDRLPSKKIQEKIQGNSSLLCKPEFSSTTKTSCFIKNTKNKHSSASDWREYTKYRFKENAKILSKNSTTQQDIRISKPKKDYEICTKRKFRTKN